MAYQDKYLNRVFMKKRTTTLIGVMLFGIGLLHACNEDPTPKEIAYMSNTLSPAGNTGMPFKYGVEVAEEATTNLQGQVEAGDENRGRHSDRDADEASNRFDPANCKSEHGKADPNEPEYLKRCPPEETETSGEVTKPAVDDYLKDE